MKARASVTAMPSRSVEATASSTAGRLRPNSATAPPQISAVVASIAGYIGEIFSPQPEHLPRRKSQETRGTFSYHRMAWPHEGQREGGYITDCFGSAPHRRMQTLRKLPSTAPSSAKYPITRP